MATILKLPNVIEPSKLVLEDYEIIAFEKEEELDYYSLWHDKFRGKSLDDQTPQPSRSKPPVTQTRSQQQQKQTQDKQQQQQQQQQSQQQPDRSEESSRPHVGQNQSRSSSRPNSLLGPQLQRAQQRQSPAQPRVPSQVLQPEQAQLHTHGQHVMPQLQTTTQDGKVLMKYKLTKLYNKLRGRQMRRNFVLERQKIKRIESEIAKGQLNSWLAYTALQALRLPDSNINQLSTIAINNNPKLITIPQPNNVSAPDNQSATPKKKGSKKPPSTPANQTPPQAAPPMHYVYLDPNDIVTYSNRIFPQQIVAYRKRSHLLPSSATSKKSSAASYDAYEIMEVLANSDNTNVTITRNANKPAPAGCSIYSHSINNNTKTPGIVSTQLHLQARSYLDSVAKFYSEEAVRIAEEEEKLRNEPSIEEQISKYIKIKNN